MPTLYEISERIRSVIEEGFSFDEETGEVFDESDLDALRMELSDKLENVALYVKGLEADAKAIREEEKALSERRKSKERKAERLREYMARTMSDNGIPSIETARCRLSFRRSERVEILDESALPVEYWRAVKQPDRQLIREVLKSGRDVPGCDLVEQENLQLR